MPMPRSCCAASRLVHQVVSVCRLAVYARHEPSSLITNGAVMPMLSMPAWSCALRPL